MSLRRHYFQIDSSKSIPLYVQIQENMLELIDLGMLKAGDALPSERELSQYYGVNRMTVRQAIDGLVQRGLIIKQHGVGTFISEQKPVQPFMPTVTGFSQRMREAGLRPSSKLIQQQVIMPTPMLAHRLNIAATEQVIMIQRLRYVNDEPLMLETSYLSFERFQRILAHDISDHSLYQIMKEEYNVQVAEAEHTFEPMLINSAESEHFGLPEGQPAMLVRVLAYGQDRRVMEFSKSVVRGDRCRYYFRVTTHTPIIV